MAKGSMMDSHQSRSKPTLIFIHGAWHGAWAWAPFMEYFSSRGYDCIAVDLPGHGKRRRIFWYRFFGIGTYLKDLQKTIDRYPDGILIGHSVGGLILQRYLAKKKARGAVLITPVPYNGIPWRNIFHMLFTIPLATLRLLFFLTSVAKERWIRTFYYTDETDPKIIDEAKKHLVPESTFILWRISLLGKFHVWKYPFAGGTPMLMLTAGRDYFLTVRCHEKLARYYGAELKVYREMPHNLMSDNDWGQVAKDIERWIALLVPAGEKKNSPLT